MKVWIFFLKPSEELKDVPVGEVDSSEKYRMYAVTQEKLLAKAFRITRDMTNFIERETKVDEDEIDDWLIAHRGQILTNNALRSFKDKNTDKQTPLYIGMPMTENEMNFIQEVMDSYAVFNQLSFMVTPEIFTYKMKKVLEYLQYDRVYSFNMMNRYASEDVDFEVPGITDESLNVTFDEFGVFLLYYGKMLCETGFSYLKMSDDPMSDELNYD